MHSTRPRSPRTSRSRPTNSDTCGAQAAPRLYLMRPRAYGGVPADFDYEFSFDRGSVDTSVKAPQVSLFCLSGALSDAVACGL